MNTKSFALVAAVLVTLASGCGRTEYVYVQTPPPKPAPAPSAYDQIQGQGPVQDAQRMFYGLGEGLRILEGLGGRR